MMSEIETWLFRIVTLIPELIGLWEAAKSAQPDKELEASLALVRKIKDRQAFEEIQGP